MKSFQRELLVAHDIPVFTAASCVYFVPHKQPWDWCASVCSSQGFLWKGLVACVPVCLCNSNKIHICAQVRQVTATAQNDSAFKFTSVPPTHILVSKSFNLSPYNLHGCRFSGIFSRATEAGFPVTTFCVMSKLQGSFAYVTVFGIPQFRLWLLWILSSLLMRTEG